ncbi:MAG TPA: glycosyltransferase family 4 protein [Casimicrobiaceae bacterium]|jgi:glycosyltransferase involved in cell wall biosynthesis
MRIAQIAPLYESSPPRLYGGTERVVAWLTDELVSMGHDVTLFGSADSRTRARMVAVREQAIRLDPNPLKSDVAAHLSMLFDVRACADEFDILHFHIDPLQFPFFESQARHTVTTLHGRLDLSDLAPLYRRWSHFPLVSISRAQREPLPFVKWVGTVHHGLPKDLLRFSPRHEGYLAFLGRISPEKRPDRAIRIARRAGMTLRMAAKIDAVDRSYFDEAIEPLMMQPPVEFLGEIGDRDKNALLGGAAALVFPIDWPEPFGLVMIEAMACGTPVIAWGCGSVGEVIDHGETGFIVHSEDEAVEAVARIGTIDRAHVRRVFERRFSARAMARGYLEVYARVLGRDGERGTRVAEYERV